MEGGCHDGPGGLDLILPREHDAVATAADGHQAMQYLESNVSPVVMLLDLMMPVRSGWMVLADLAAQPALAARVRVVVVSASGPERASSIHNAVDAVPAKPIQLPELIATLRTVAGTAVASLQH